MVAIKQVLTDIDGTLVQHWQDQVSESVCRAIKDCEARGIKVTPVTGRPYAMARPVLQVLSFNELGIFDGGATIQHCLSGEIIWSKWLDAATIRRIVEIVAPHSTIIDYEPGMNDRDPSTLNLDDIVLESPGVFAIVPLDTVGELEAQLAAIPGLACCQQPGHADIADKAVIEVSHIEATKSHGVDKLLEITGVDKRHTLAIGDGNNDVPLFQHAALKVAMGNATENLQSIADYVVGSVDADGFVEAMERFVLHGRR